MHAWRSIQTCFAPGDLRGQREACGPRWAVRTLGAQGRGDCELGSDCGQPGFGLGNVFCWCWRAASPPGCSVGGRKRPAEARRRVGVVSWGCSHSVPLLLHQSPHSSPCCSGSPRPALTATPDWDALTQGRAGSPAGTGARPGAFPAHFVPEADTRSVRTTSQDRAPFVHEVAGPVRPIPAILSPSSL